MNHSNDLAFDLTGYAYVLVNNLFAASYTVYVKKRLSAAKVSSNNFTIKVMIILKLYDIFSTF